MKQELLEIQNALYVGMDLYKQLKNTKTIINDYKFTEEDNKYLSLYLGILYTDNKITRLLKKNQYFKLSKYMIQQWDDEEYLKIYKENFSNILGNINFESIFEYCEFILNQKAIRKYDSFDKINIVRQKILVKA